MAAHSAKKFGRGGQGTGGTMPNDPPLASDPEEKMDILRSSLLVDSASTMTSKLMRSVRYKVTRML